MNKMELILSSDFIISFGTFIEDKQLSDSISKAVENNGAKFVYMHPIDNKVSVKQNNFSVIVKCFCFKL